MAVLQFKKKAGVLLFSSHYISSCFEILKFKIIYFCPKYTDDFTLTFCGGPSLLYSCFSFLILLLYSGTSFQTNNSSSEIFLMLWAHQDNYTLEKRQHFGRKILSFSCFFQALYFSWISYVFQVFTSPIFRTFFSFQCKTGFTSS